MRDMIDFEQFVKLKMTENVGVNPTFVRHKSSNCCLFYIMGPYPDLDRDISPNFDAFKSIQMGLDVCIFFHIFVLSLPEGMYMS